MPNDPIKIQIDQSALDEAQAKADKLLATLQQIERSKRRPADASLIFNANIEYVYQQGARLRVADAIGMAHDFWMAIEMGGVVLGWIRFKLLDMIMGERLFEAIELRPASEGAPDSSEIWSPFLSMCRPKNESAASPAADVGQTSHSFLEASHDVVVKNKAIEPPASVTPSVDVQSQILTGLQKEKIENALCEVAKLGGVASVTSIAKVLIEGFDLLNSHRVLSAPPHISP